MTAFPRLLIRGFLPLFIALPILCQNLLAQDSAVEESAIRGTVLNYLEGWYEGNAERMDKALHPDLVKRIVYTDPRTGRSLYNEASKTLMMEYTRAGLGKKDIEDKDKIAVSILAVDGEIAMVKSVTPQFVDYIHLAKWNDEWKIVNVLWTQGAKRK